MSRLAIALLLVSSLVHAQPVAEPEPERRTPFDQGRFGLGFGFGRQTTLGASYNVVSGGLGYFVLDGVALDLGLGVQFGDGPTIMRTTPGVRYVAQPLVGVSPLVPYVGVFSSRYFIASGIDDVSTVGGRAGLLYVSGSLLLGLGVGVERIVSECTEDCTSLFPDVTLSVAF